LDGERGGNKPSEEGRKLQREGGNDCTLYLIINYSPEQRKKKKASEGNPKNQILHVTQKKVHVTKLT